jgi:hypothetical protein
MASDRAPPPMLPSMLPSMLTSVPPSVSQSSPMSAPAWVEPGTASLLLYCLALLLRGRAGARVLARSLRRGRDTVADIALDEFGDFLCDHPDALIFEKKFEVIENCHWDKK